MNNIGNKKSKLSLKAEKSWFLSRSIFLVILAIVVCIGRYILAKKIGSYIAVDIIIAICLILQLLNTLVYPKFEYKQWWYEITEDRIIYNEGIWFRNLTIIPIVRVQHINITEGPINRIYGLADLEINTAGGSFKIPNIEKAVVEELAENLRVRIEENVREELMS